MTISLRTFRGLWYGLAAAGILSLLISWRTNSPYGWQILFCLIVAVFLVIGSTIAFFASDPQLTRLRQPLFRLRQHDGWLFLVFFSTFMVMLVAGIGLWYEYLTYVGFVPILIGGSLLLLLILGSSTTYKQAVELAAKGFLSLISVVLALVIVDVAISTYYRTRTHWEDDSYTQYDDDLGWRLRSHINQRNGEFVTNSLGYRNAPEPDGIPEDTLVIGVQGDSQLEGFGVDKNETFDSVLQTCLSERLDQPVVVINLGVRGYDLHHYLTQNQIVKGQYDFDWMIMLFNSTNDYDRSMFKTAYAFNRPYWTLDNNGELRRVDSPSTFALQIYPIEFQDAFSAYNHYLDYDRSLNFSIDPDHPLAWSWAYITLERRLFDMRSPETPDQKTLDEDKFFVRFFWHFADPLPDLFLAYQPTFEAIMQAWKAEWENAQVFILPMNSEVAWDAPGFQDAAEGIYQRLGRGEPRPTAFLEWVEGIFRSLDMPVYNFYEDMVGYGNALDLFFPNNSHLNAEGYRVIGEAACDVMEERILGSRRN